VAGPEAALALDEAALLIAAHGRPDLDVAAQQRRLDALAGACGEPTVEGVRRHLFEVVGLRGDRRRYHDPRNSFLDAVLDRRQGIPISLAVVTVEVARRLGVALLPVAMPGHFLVGVPGEAGATGGYLDPFGGGRRLDREGCQALYRAVFGAGARLADEMLAPVGPRAVLARMLANLRTSYLAAGDVRSLGWVHRLRAAIPAATEAELADRARALAELARFSEAAQVLDELGERLAGPRGARARAAAALVRARLN